MGCAFLLGLFALRHDSVGVIDVVNCDDGVAKTRQSRCPSLACHGSVSILWHRISGMGILRVVHSILVGHHFGRVPLACRHLHAQGKFNLCVRAHVVMGLASLLIPGTVFIA